MIPKVKEMTMQLFTLLLVFPILFLGGCATMNEAECLHADWTAIGMEDGTRGRDLSYLSRHRKACAKHGISPEVAPYMSGYKAGLAQFCVPERGLQLGLSGGRYNGICPEELTNPFVTAYQQGYGIFQAEQRIKKVSTRINDQKEYLNELHDEIKATKSQIISAKTPEKDRGLLLKELKILEREREDTKTEIWQLKQHKKNAIFQLGILRQQAGI